MMVNVLEEIDKGFRELLVVDYDFLCTKDSSDSYDVFHRRRMSHVLIMIYFF